MSEIIRKAREGLQHCMPQTEEEAKTGCRGCPYADRKKEGCDDWETVALSVEMVKDIRKALDEAEEIITEMRGALRDAAARTMKKEGNG